MTVDYGKIIALHNAGWSITKIADEMRMTDEEYCSAITDKLDEIDAKICTLERKYRKWASLILEE